MKTLFSIAVRRLALLAVAAGLFVALWTILLDSTGASGLIARQPSQVWSYLFESADAPVNRHAISEYLSETVVDFAVGYVGGLSIAVALAIVFSLSLLAERVVMPTATVLRSIPVIVLTPLITLVFGVGLYGITAIVTLVVFLPALAIVYYGIRTGQTLYDDLIRAYGGSRLDLLRKAALPAALPAMFAAARISIPAAMTGALIGEWVATGTGIGGFIARSSSSFGYDAMWASAVATTLVTMLAYTVISVLDTFVRERHNL